MMSIRRMVLGAPQLSSLGAPLRVTHVGGAPADPFISGCLRALCACAGACWHGDRTWLTADACVRHSAAVTAAGPPHPSTMLMMKMLLHWKYSRGPCKCYFFEIVNARL